MHALKREREALAAVEMEAGHGSRVSVSTGYDFILSMFDGYFRQR